jgi:hypothetical protein
MLLAYCGQFASFSSQTLKTEVVRSSETLPRDAELRLRWAEPRCGQFGDDVLEQFSHGWMQFSRTSLLCRNCWNRYVHYGHATRHSVNLEAKLLSDCNVGNTDQTCCLRRLQIGIPFLAGARHTRIYFHHSIQTGFGAHGFRSPGVKWPGRESDHSPPCRAEVTMSWYVIDDRDNITFY